jgi:hypothetical protein
MTVAVGVLSACSSLDGTYTGQCTIVMDGADNVFDVEVELIQSGSGSLDGEGSVVNSLDEISVGDIDGSWDGDDVFFDIEFEPNAVMAGAMSFAGIAHGDEIDGQCSWTNFSDGSFDLKRED